MAKSSFSSNAQYRLALSVSGGQSNTLTIATSHLALPHHKVAHFRIWIFGRPKLLINSFVVVNS